VLALFVIQVKQKNAATRVVAGHAEARPSVSGLPVFFDSAGTFAGGRCIQLAPAPKAVCPGGSKVVQLSDADHRVVPRNNSVHCFVLFKLVARWFPLL
jgi:hypothetical protein